MTRDEAVEACVARGDLRRPECEQWVEAQLVDGTWCDGTVVVDVNGRRCVTRDVQARRAALLERERVERARRLEVEGDSSSRAWLVLGALVVVAGAILVAGRD